MKRALPLMFCLLLCASTISFAETTQSASSDEQAVWNLEHAYWDYVQANDLVAYRQLWHERFVGWPSVSAAPVDKSHITDWITSQTSNGMAFKTIEFKPARFQMTGNIAMA